MGLLDDLRTIRTRLSELERKVTELSDDQQVTHETQLDHESRISAIESLTEQWVVRLDELGGYKKRNTEELRAVRTELRVIEQSLTHLTDAAVHERGLEEARAFRLRVRKNLGYVNTTLSERGVA